MAKLKCERNWTAEIATETEALAQKLFSASSYTLPPYWEDKLRAQAADNVAHNRQGYWPQT